MSAGVARRGTELARGGRNVGIGPRWLAHLWSGGIHRIFDRIGDGLERGSIEAILPDGSTQLLGGRMPGFAASVELHDWRAVLRLATGGSVGWYQAWEAGEWDSSDPVTLFALFMDNASALGGVARARGPWRWLVRLGHRLKRNTRAGALRNIRAHYDLGNDFYSVWLDPTMNYSSARFDGAELSLAEAQRRKIEAIADRLDGAATVLEIGCGWGSLAEALADAGMMVTGISLSDEQLEWARHHHPHASVEFRKQDYRDIRERFDAIASVEMVEAVGREYWPAFFDAIARCLKPGGRAAIQYIAIRDDLFESYARSADFIQTYIFPGGMLVSEREFRELAGQRGLTWENQVSFGSDYAETLRRWRLNFDRAVDEGRLPPGFDDRFVRLWRFYLMYCEGGFRGRGIDVSQVTLRKPD